MVMHVTGKGTWTLEQDFAGNIVLHLKDWKGEAHIRLDDSRERYCIFDFMRMVMDIDGNLQHVWQEGQQGIMVNCKLCQREVRCDLAFEDISPDGEDITYICEECSPNP